MVLIWNRKGTIRTFLPNQNWRCFLHHEDFSHFLGWKLLSQFLGWKNALTLHLIGSDGFPFHKDSKYGPNSKNMKSTKRTFLQSTAELASSAHLNCYFMFQWFCTAACTYGLIYASTGLVGNPYLNFFIVAVVGFPARIIGLYLFDRWAHIKTPSMKRFEQLGCGSPA